MMDKRQFRRDTLSGDSFYFSKKRNYVLKENTLKDKKYVSIYEMLWYVLVKVGRKNSQELI